MPVDLGRLDLPVGLIPAADEVDADVTRACDHKEPKQAAVLDIILDAVEDVLCQVNKEEYIEDLLDRILEQSKYEKQFICFPYLFHSI